MLEFFRRVDFELRGDVHELRALQDLRVDDVADDGLIFAREIFVQQISKLGASDCRLGFD